MRVRGLKHEGNLVSETNGWSHPVRVRGLKPVQIPNRSGFDLVAPRAGAWIETVSGLLRRSAVFVAPRAGAWIETES